MDTPTIFDQEIIHSTLINAPIEKVFKVFTTAEGLDSWFTQGAAVDDEVGGKIYFRWVSERADVKEGVIEDGGPILEINAPYKFTFEWYPDNKSYATTVKWCFEETEKGTKITVKEHGFHNTPKGRKALLDCATGWGEALTMAKYFIEHGVKC
ncbi:MAG: SRPBCC domain-containing protein [Candidatus Heimdallarchaeota archaeon]|nr:SRPBCC domain-containing protein [Candidatus Heimdallarchaeota archaeon]